jgi:hypothetical protein
MSTLKRADFRKELQQGLNAVFGKAYMRYPELWKQVFEVNTSQKAFEEEVLSVGFALAPVKSEGSGVNYDSAADSYIARYNHETIALAFAITEEAEEDGLYGSLGARYAQALARSLQETKNVKGFNILNNAFSSSYLGGDGVSLLNTAHPLYGGGTQSNKLATPADLAEASLEDAINQIALFTDDRGLFINAKVQSVIVPTASQFIINRLLKSTYRPGTGDNDINSINEMGAIPQGAIVAPYITDTDSWYLKTDVQDGLKHFVRKKVARGIEGDFETGNVRYKARERYVFGWSDWRGLFGSEGG